MRRALAAAVLVAILAAACRREEEAIRERLQEKGTADVMAELAKASYDPPADGRLTERQVRMYLEIKERGRAIRKVAAEDGVEEDGPAVTDLRAAVELGHNPKEFTWAGERVAEAEEAAALSALEQRVGQSREEYLAMLEEERKAAGDDAQRAEIDRQIEEFQRAREVRTAVSQAVRHNIELLSRYEEELAEARLADARLKAAQRQEGGR